MNNEQLIRQAKNGCEESKRELFSRNDKFCRHMANRWKSSLNPEDALSAARFGMVRAYNVFDPDRGLRFITFAGRCIENELRMQYKKNKRWFQADSFTDAVLKGKDDSESPVEEYIGEDDPRFQDLETNEIIRNVIQELKAQSTEKQMIIFHHRFFSDIQQTELGKILGVTQGYIAGTEKILKKRLRKIAEEQGVIV